MKELLLGTFGTLSIFLSVFYILKRASEVPIERRWIDEETVCFYAGRVPLNCETVRGWE